MMGWLASDAIVLTEFIVHACPEVSPFAHRQPRRDALPVNEEQRACAPQQHAHNHPEKHGAASHALLATALDVNLDAALLGQCTGAAVGWAGAIFQTHHVAVGREGILRQQPRKKGVKESPVILGTMGDGGLN